LNNSESKTVTDGDHYKLRNYYIGTVIVLVYILIMASGLVWYIASRWCGPLFLLFHPLMMLGIFILFLPGYFLVKTIRTWKYLDHKSAAMQVLTIFMMVRLIVGGIVYYHHFPMYVSLLYGTRDRIKNIADIASIRNWYDAKRELAENGTVMVNPAEWPECIKSLSATSVSIQPRDVGVCISFKNRTVLVVGPVTMVTPPSAKGFRVIPLASGSYIFNAN